MSLSALPCETLTLILEVLAASDLASLILAQRVCRRFHAVIERILFHNPPSLSLSQNITEVGEEEEFKDEDEDENGTSYPKRGNENPALITLPPLLQHNFGALLYTGDIISASHRNPGNLFRELPWVAARCADAEDGIVREKHMRDSPFLRPEASWRRLSATWGLGDPDRDSIRSLDVVKSETAYGGTGMSFDQLEIPSSCSPTPSKVSKVVSENGNVCEDGNKGGILTLGFLYDLLASGEGHVGRTTKRWFLLHNRKLNNYDDWLRHQQIERYVDVDTIKSFFVPEQGSAVLLVAGFRGCRAFKKLKPKSSEDEQDMVWEPKSIGDENIVIHMWQGCELRPVR